MSPDVCPGSFGCLWDVGSQIHVMSYNNADNGTVGAPARVRLVDAKENLADDPFPHVVQKPRLRALSISFGRVGRV